MKKKQASRDFTINDLPSNRKEVFFDCVKNRYRYLLYCGLFLFLTSIPIIVVFFLKNIYLSALLEELNNGAISVDDYRVGSITYLFLFDGLIVAFSFILSLGVCGMTRVIRQIAWEEPLFFFKDFTDGIKINYKNISIHILVFTIVYMSSDLALYVNMGFILLNYIPTGILLFIILPILLYNVSQANIYVVSNIKSTKNSTLFLIKTIPVCLLFSLIISLVLFLNFIPNYTIKLLVYILLLILAFPLYYLTWFLYSCSIFDKNLNINYYPEMVDKGIVRKDK